MPEWLPGFTSLVWWGIRSVTDYICSALSNSRNEGIVSVLFLVYLKNGRNSSVSSERSSRMHYLPAFLFEHKS